MKNKPELLAPAGQPDAGYAALHYGADAVYLGLGRFSARAEAVNFSPGELASFAAHAHSLTPRRNVYLTLNTLVQNHELPGAVETLAIAADCGVDAVIVQDLGIASLVRDKFPGLALHASTQMAIHNLDGALAAKRLGCARVTLARELTLNEVADIAENSGLEIETFIHGTLCYSYSGLCLFSSVATGRSGNRGRCVYSCREALADRRNPTHPFSLKDMALGPRVLDLAKIGVSSLKIEGRKKSPLYVAATVDYYRRILDGTFSPGDAEAAAERLKTIFARPWTTLFLDGTHNPDAADTDIVGHRGAPLGVIEKLVRTPAGPGIALTPRLPVERHDGVQIDLPGDPRPYGFAVDNLFVPGKKQPQSAFAAPAGAPIQVALPPDAPALTPGMAVYQSSSQAVKRSYPYPGSRNAGFGSSLICDVSVAVTPGSGSGLCDIAVSAVAAPPPFLFQDNPEPLTASFSMQVESFPARDAGGPEQAAARAFERTGGSRFRPGSFRFENRDGLFVKPGVWNRLRRRLVAELENEYGRRLEAFKRKTIDALPRPNRAGPETTDFSWSICVDDAAGLAAFTAEDFAAAEEVVVGMDSARAETMPGELEALAERCGRDKLRLSVPLILRPPHIGPTRALAAECMRLGWKRWFVSNPGAFSLLGDVSALDMTADWMLYALNPLAVRQIFALGCRAFTLSPEDDADNLRELAALYPEQAHVVAYSDLPLFISAACAHAHLGMCAQSETGQYCPKTMKIISTTLEKSGGIEITPQQCGSVVTGDRPFSLLGRLDLLNGMNLNKLRIDLRWRRRQPDAVAALWRSALKGQFGIISEANFSRKLF